MRRLKAAVMILGVAGCALTAMAATLPFEDQFDTGTNGQEYNNALNDWVFGDTAGVATNKTSPKTGTTLSLYSEESVTLPISGDVANMWFHCYTLMRPVTADESADIGTNAIGFYLGTNEQLYAYSSNAWVSVATGVSTNDTWHGFSVQVDFDNERWNLYRTGNGHTDGDALDLVNTTGPLHFNTNFTGSALTGLEVSGMTYLDDVRLDEYTIAVGTDPAPAYVGPLADTTFKRSDDAYGVSLGYFGGSGNMNSDFGNILAELFTDDDKITFFYGGTQKTFTLSGGSWTSVGGIDYEVTPGMGMYVQLLGAGTRKSSVTMAYGSSQTAHSGSRNIEGNDGDEWTLLSVPFTATGGRTLTQLGLPAGTLDRLYVRSGGKWIELYYDGAWKQLIGGQTYTATLPAGTGFWLRRRSGPGTTWDLTGL